MYNFKLEMDYKELSEYLPKIEDIIQYSIRNSLNVHSYLGGKYGELHVIKELWKHKPKIAHERTEVKIKNPKSCDIVLADSKKKLEIKWGKFHDEKDKMTLLTNGIPFWGWGFSKGRQFLEKKFDYCILLAAEKGGAKPEHTFVLRIDEMNNYTMGGERKSVVSSKGSYYIEYSNDQKFYEKRKWHPYGPSVIETILQNKETQDNRWHELKNNGELE